MEKIYIPQSIDRRTQDEFGTYSHAGAFQIDWGGLNYGNVQDPCFAPCTMKLVARLYPGTIQETNCFESVDKVHFADDSEDYCRIWFTHPNMLDEIGTVFKQGSQVCLEGGPYGSYHLHTDIGKGRHEDNGGTSFIKNVKGTYIMPNACSHYDAMWVLPDTKIISENMRNFRVDNNEDTKEESEVVKAKGIDISSWQNGLDLSKIKDQIDFVILRCGYTGYGRSKSKNEDKNFDSFYAQAKSLNIPVGCYYYSCATDEEEAKEEANKVLEIIKGKTFEYPIFFDTEDNHDITNEAYAPSSQRSIGKQSLTKVAKAFCEVIEKAGYYVSIYASTSWLNNQLSMNDLQAYDVWIAHYNTEKPTYKGNYGMWQYSSKGKLNGYNGNLDMNNAYKDYPSIMKEYGLNGYSKNEKPTPINPYISGKRVHLTNTYLFASSTASRASAIINGNYFLWNDVVINNRIRITNGINKVGKNGQVTGWINIYAVQ